MDLTNRDALKVLLARYQLTLAKTYGQHFLVDRGVLEEIVAAAFPQRHGAVGRSPRVIEVGPGVGTLTRELAARAEHVVAIERDPRFFSVLRETVAEFSNIELIQADALRVSFAQFSPYHVISNLPYEITTPFLWKILYEEQARPERAVLLLQRDIVDRILACPPRMNLLALLAALVGKARRVCAVSPRAFFPLPRVESAVLAIEDIEKFVSLEEKTVLAMAKRAFAAPRKKLSSTLGQTAGRFGNCRPAELGVGEWKDMAAATVRGA